MGQHFLTDRNIISRIAAAAELNAGDTVIEIGSGPGDLTAEVARVAGKVVAVELDAALVGRLRERFGGVTAITVAHEDALTIGPAALIAPEGTYVAVGNLPYNAGSAIVRHLLESEPRPSRLVVMLQKEVAMSMIAPPGEMGLLAVGVQVYASGRRLFDVAPGAFYPPPKVMSSVIRLDVHAEPLVTAAERDAFFRVVRAGFSAPRKQLRNSLANGLGLNPRACEGAIRAAGLSPDLRPRLLSIPDWLALTRELDVASD